MNKDRIAHAIGMIQRACSVLMDELEEQNYVGSEAQQIFALSTMLANKPELTLKEHMQKRSPDSEV